MKSRWCQRASLRRRRFRGSNSVPFSDLFRVRTVLAISATTASPIGPALVHQRRAAWTVRVGGCAEPRVQFGALQAVLAGAAAGPGLGFGFDARGRSLPWSLGGTSAQHLASSGHRPQTTPATRSRIASMLAEGRAPLNRSAHLGTVRPSRFILP